MFTKNFENKIWSYESFRSVFVTKLFVDIFSRLNQQNQNQKFYNFYGKVGLQQLGWCMKN